MLRARVIEPGQSPTRKTANDARRRSERCSPDGRHVGQVAASDEENGDDVVREHLPVVLAPRLDIDDDGLVDVEGEPA